VVWAPDTFTCNCWALQGHSSSLEGFSIAVCFLHRAACQAQFHAQQVAISHNRLSKTTASMLLCPLVAPDPGRFPHQNQGGLAAPCVCVESVEGVHEASHAAVQAAVVCSEWAAVDVCALAPAVPVHPGPGVV
jgi:hypothetical protein